MSYYYELLNQQSGELIYDSDVPFDTIQDALVDAKSNLMSREAFWRVFTTPPGRSEYEEPQVTSSISPEFESDVPELDWKMMLKIHSAVYEAVQHKQATLTGDELDDIIHEVSGWDTDTEVGAEYHAEAYELVMDRKAHVYEQVEGGNPTTPTGTCYPDAWRYVMRHPEAVLVHGSTMTLSGRLGHAWVELPDGTIWEPSSQAILTADRFNALVDPIVEERYTMDEAAHMLSVGKHGPWDTEERMKHIGR